MEITRDTPLEVAITTWQITPPETSLVLVVKATFAIVADGLCVLADEQELCTGDTPHDEDETCSLRYASDVVPFKRRGECLLAGTCHPPGGRATLSAVGLRVGHVLKELAIFGDREWGSLLSAGVPQPRPFESMPLRWERSFGGAGHERNPFGRGASDVETPEGKKRLLPNIEDPQQLVRERSSRPRPAGAFPLPAEWRAKDARLGTYDGRYVQERWPFLPADFDWGYFNAAPEDQRIDGYWSADEPIELRNLHPRHPVIHTRLPGLRPRAFLTRRAHGVSGFEEVALRLDTITVDADAMRVLCVWRGLRTVASEALDDVEHLFVAHEGHGQERPLPLYAQRLAELLLERDEALAELEGEAPPEPDEDTSVTVVPPPGPDDELTKATDALDAKLKSLGVLVAAPAVADPPEPLTAARVAEMKAAMASAGMEPPAELDALLVLLAPPPDAPETPPEPEAPAGPDRDVLLARLRAGESVDAEDWSGVDLSELDLRGLDLSGALLAGARFVRADLGGARLDRAQLSGADLTEATLREASLAESDLTGATLQRCDLSGACLDHAWMEGARLAGSHLPRASLREALLVEADLERCHMPGAILDGADLSCARLSDVDLRGASLVETTLEAAVLQRSILEDADLTRLRASEGADFVDVSFRGAKAPGSRWMGAKLDKANLSFVDLERADFSGASLVQALLHGCSIRSGSFRNAKLVGAQANKTDFFEATFEGADLAYADLRGSSLFGAQLWRARTDGLRLDLADLGRTGLAR